MTGRVLAVVLGAVIVVLTGADAISTLVTTRRGRKRWWPTEVFYRVTWRAWRRGARRIRRDERREAFLSVYGPASLLGLLVMWILLQLLGWSFVWLGLRSELSDVHDLWDALYYAGVGFFTIGFGDIVPNETPARMLTLFQAFTGLLTTALVIGYLPTLYSAYSRREELLPTLDTVQEHVTGLGLIGAHYPPGDPGALWEFCLEWERWCAAVEVSHGSYPMLALFRSQRPHQSWLSGLSIVTDLAVTLAAVIDVPRRLDALRLYRRAVRVVDIVGHRVPTFAIAPRPDPLDELAFRAGYDMLASRGVPLRPFEAAWTDVRSMRDSYLPRLTALADALLVSTRFTAPDVPIPAHLLTEATGASPPPPTPA
ncbi:MAG TPA: potassium channel family protein [Acidimicrobiia bacterium]